MSSIRKIALGVLVAGLAVVGSAFTNRTLKYDPNQPIQESFFNTSGTPSDDPSDYVYNPLGACISSGPACSAEWEHLGTLSPGMSPNGDKITADVPGSYQGR